MENKFDDLYKKIITEMAENSETSDKEICKDWGLVNDLTGFKEQDFEKACDAHEKMEEKDPVFHKLVRIPAKKGSTLYQCRCGFSYTVDASNE